MDRPHSKPGQTISLGPRGAWPRRRVLKALTAAGAGSVVFGRALEVLAAGGPEVTADMIRRAEWISGLSFTDADRELMLEGTNRSLENYARLREVRLDNSIPPAIRFDPAPLAPAPGPAQSVGDAPDGLPPGERPARRPATDDDLAFAPVADVAPLLRARKVSSVELTRLYLERLRRFDPVLRCVINYTEDLALHQAEAADREIATGRYRGPLHGVPWGAKDLLAVPGHPTTWGASPYEDQIRPEKATVAARLEKAGAVLVAKLSVGALAWGDVWFGGTTMNPWNTKQGSSGSSAGPSSATAAGLVGFAIGTETWGSIVSPCTRCGATGLRPTFGRVSRYGAMALSWSMDKIGPIARSVEDCALVFRAIHGSDGRDATAVDRPFIWPPERGLDRLRVGFVPSLFEEDRTGQADDETEAEGLREWREFDLRSLDTLRGLGAELVPMKLPATYPVSALGLILSAEATTAFDALTRSGRDDLLTRQSSDAWPNVFRQAQLIPAVEYLRANRIRTLVMREMETTLSGVDVYVTPTFGGVNLLLTNLTGHPTVVVPNGFRSHDGTPTSITFTGKLFGESNVLAVARAYQTATEFHLRRPPLG